MSLPGKASLCRLLARLWFNHKLLGNMVLMATLLFTFGGLVVLAGAALHPWWTASAWEPINIGCAIALSTLAPLMGWGFIGFLGGLERVPRTQASSVHDLLARQGLSTRSDSSPSRMEAWMAQEGFEPTRRAKERAAQLTSSLPVVSSPRIPKARL